ncbi:transmembrane protein 271-like [Phycodurus eques]|uniref:transmembrane protein 271-like n=1 Tax=Phycodurus eques TaxID=693459 RepID=UPI002ACE966E|nr:transmembrane protein 271-like [Phycodurus eques]
MRWSGDGLRAVVSGALLSACALGELVLGLRCVSLGSGVREPFRLGGAAAGAFYSALLVGGGQLLLGVALRRRRRPRPRGANLVLPGLVVFLLGILTAFSGAVVDGDAASLVRRKYARHCAPSGRASRACEALREYQRTLVMSAALSALECLLGLVNLALIQRYEAARRRQGRGSSAHLRPVSYVDLAAADVLGESGAEARRGGHPSVELPGYSPADPRLDRCFPSSYPPPGQVPPVYEDVFPAGERVIFGQSRVSARIERHGGATLQSEDNSSFSVNICSSRLYL